MAELLTGNDFECDRRLEPVAHLTQQGFQRFWGSAGVRMVLLRAIVAQMASKIRSGLDIQMRPLI